MPLSFDDFVLSPRCPKLVLADEDQPQDASDWNRIQKQHQQIHYERYLSQFEPVEGNVAKQVALQSNGDNKSRAEYFRNYRRRPKRCPHCGKDIKR